MHQTSVLIMIKNAIQREIKTIVLAIKRLLLETHFLIK
jgi:hypothetical protein